MKRISSHRFNGAGLSVLLVSLALVSLPLPLSTAQLPQDNRQLQRDSTQPTNQTTQRRIALVIGNGAYTNAPPLRNPPNDARDMAATLKTLGFDVTSGVNVDQRDMKRLIREFGQKLKSGGSGLFYFAGHGVQSKGKNYLIPIEADIQSEIEVEDSGVDVNLVLGYMDDAQNGLNIVILDACRNNPFARSFRSASNGLAQVDAPTGTLIAYATAPGRVASDGTGQNGLYTSELLKQMQVAGLSVTDMFMRVRAEVMKQTSGKQVPWEASSLVGAFYFSGGTGEVVPAGNTSTPITSGQPPSTTRPSAASGASSQDGYVIATKDIGSLRVVLKSVMPMTIKDPLGRTVKGIRCIFEFVNRDTQRPIAAAMNAWPFGSVPTPFATYGDVGAGPGNVLRATLLDERGSVWSLYPLGVTGMSIVSVGRRDSGGVFSPTEIPSLLQRQDETGTDTAKYAFVFGSTTIIPPGQSVTVILSFAKDLMQATYESPSNFFQISSEIVVGVETEGKKKSYSLHNLTFDRISLPQ